MAEDKFIDKAVSLFRKQGWQQHPVCAGIYGT